MSELSERYDLRTAFPQCVDFSETHWLDRPILPNQLAVPPERLLEEKA